MRRGEIFDVDACGDVAHSEVSEGKDADLVDKNINEIGTRVWCVTVEFEKAAVVSLGEGDAHLEGMLHGLLPLLFRGELLEHARGFSLQFTKNKVQKLIGQELLQV